MHKLVFLALCAVPLVTAVPQQGPDDQGTVQLQKHEDGSAKQCHGRTVTYVTTYEPIHTQAATDDSDNDATLTKDPYEAGAGYAINPHPTIGMDDPYGEDEGHHHAGYSSPAGTDGAYADPPYNDGDPVSPHYNDGEDDEGYVDPDAGEDGYPNHPPYNTGGDVIASTFTTSVPVTLISTFTFTTAIPTVISNGTATSTSLSISTFISVSTFTTTETTDSVVTTTATPPTLTVTTDVADATITFDVLSIRPAAATGTVAAVKRQNTLAPGGYLGSLTDPTADPNPNTCASAVRVLFNRGRFIANGVTISVNAGLSSISLSNARNGSITTDFSIQNNILVWRNPSFFNGVARFCQIGNQIPLALFTNADPPENCVLIDLVAFTSAACDNGELPSRSEATVQSSTSQLATSTGNSSTISRSDEFSSRTSFSTRSSETLSPTATESGSITSQSEGSSSRSSFSTRSSETLTPTTTSSSEEPTSSTISSTRSRDTESPTITRSSSSTTSTTSTSSTVNPTSTPTTPASTTSSTTTSDNFSSTSATTPSPVSSSSTTSSSTSSSSTDSSAITCGTAAPAYYIVDRALVREDFVLNVLNAVVAATTVIVRPVVGDGISTIDALGFNAADGFLYAAMGAAPSRLIRISPADGSYADVGSLGLTAVAVAGVVDENSQYWLTDETNTQWTQVDLLPGSATFGQVVDSGTTAAPTGLVSDWAFVPGAAGGDNLYGISSTAGLLNVITTTLQAFDRTTHTWTPVSSTIALDLLNFQSVFAGVDSVFAADSNLGLVFNFALPGAGLALLAVPIVTLAGGPTLGLADGARCVLPA